MNLLIHDLNAEQWNEISAEYAGWEVVTDDDKISPCVGCFGCWYRTPGECVIKDGHDDMGALIHNADEVVVISRYTYGGFSGAVKNIFDRSLSYILPQFEIIGGETHHKKRYDEDKPFTFIFYGHDLTDEQKISAILYVEAVCTNIRGHIKEVIFRECADCAAEGAVPGAAPNTKTVILNGSMRAVSGNSAMFARALKPQLESDPEIIDLKDYLDDMSALVRKLEEYGTIILCMPLYVDGMPSQVIRLLEKFRGEYRGRGAKIYLLANMGLYESRQLRNLFGAVKEWCDEMGFEYAGGLGISAGELLGQLTQLGNLRKGPNRRVAQGMERLAAAINSGAKMDDVYAEPFMFPRWLYILVANTNWNRLAKSAGNKPEDLYRQL
ncbi:MAG: flavodoxin family protein [Firmicutes bacterium]|nr:flavodoxin family protein [Bacillota bacterium]